MNKIDYLALKAWRIFSKEDSTAYDSTSAAFMQGFREGFKARGREEATQVSTGKQKPVKAKGTAKKLVLDRRWMVVVWYEDQKKWERSILSYCDGNYNKELAQWKAGSARYRIPSSIYGIRRVGSRMTPIDPDNKPIYPK